MKLVWHAIENADTVRDPVVAFRLNALDDLIAPPGAANADDVWWTASLELEPDDDGNRRSIKHILENLPAPIAADVLIPPEYYLPEKDGERKLDDEAEQVTVIARRSFLNLANSFDERAPPIRRIELGGIAPRNMLAYARAKPELYLGTGPATVPDGAAVVAVIDNGIAIGHNLFRKPGAGGVLNRSRVRVLLEHGRGRGAACPAALSGAQPAAMDARRDRRAAGGQHAWRPAGRGGLLCADRADRPGRTRRHSGGAAGLARYPRDGAGGGA